MHSGVAGVVIVMAALRKALGLEHVITAQHFDRIGRLQIIIAFGYAFFFWLDFTFGLFGRDPVEEHIWELRLFDSPTNLLLITQLLTTLLIPLPLWFIPRVRRSPTLMFAASVLVNIGMWFERYLVVITPLSLKQPFVFTWVETYQPQPVEIVFTAASFAMVSAGVLVFAKLLPIVPLWEVKEGQHAAGPVH
jgi:molybdopterin-containing oxidoreductase family membrane subunit